ncbi:MAG: hypothetical protein O3A02_02395 [bacterium]|nr:hypothetical protein [bacterium]
MPRRAHRPRRPTPWLALVAIALLFGCTPPSPATIDVDGRVADFGLLSASGIVVQAQGQTTVTDGEGRFALAGLTTPYDLVLSRTGGSPWLHAYEGLTTATPLLDPRRSEFVAGTAPETEVNGAIIGGPLPAGRRTIVCAEGLDVVAFGCTRVDPGEDAYVLDVTWLRPGPALVRLHALRMVVGADGLPTGYEGYERVNLTLTDGVPSTTPLALDPVPATTPVEVDVRLPSGVVSATGYLTARVSAGAALPVAAPVSLTGPLTMPVPDLEVDRHPGGGRLLTERQRDRLGPSRGRRPPHPRAPRRAPASAARRGRHRRDDGDHVRGRDRRRRGRHLRLGGVGRAEDLADDDAHRGHPPGPGGDRRDAPARS